MADEKYYQARDERMAYLQAVPEARAIGWCSPSPNAAWHRKQFCHMAGQENYRVDERYVRVHKLHPCGFCNQPPAEPHGHAPDSCEACRALWTDGYDSGTASPLTRAISLSTSETLETTS